MDKEVQELIAKFPEWRELAKFQRKMGSPYCSYAPELKDVEQMMTVIERLSKGVEHDTETANEQAD